MSQLNTRRLWPVIEAMRDLARKHCEARGIGPEDAAVAMILTGCTMLRLMGGPPVVREVLAELAGSDVWDDGFPSVQGLGSTGDKKPVGGSSDL